MINYKSTSLATNISSLKVVSTHTGTAVAPYATSYNSNVYSIPHGLGNTEIIPVMSARWSVNGWYVTSPYVTNDGRIGIYLSYDSTNVYITAYSSTAGAPQDASSFKYKLFICVP